jgi:NitT/TauT family transport system substrate-binding protein
LNTTNPAIQTLRDFTPKDKIAVPGIKTSLSAVVLQMLVAFVAALDEANDLIARDKRGAAQAYINASHVKVSEPEVLRMLADPETRFSTTPDGVMKFARFMRRVGTIAVEPQSWKDLFFPEVQGRPGS